MLNPAVPLSLTQRERQLLSLIRQKGSLSRSELIKRSGLPGVAVFRGTEELAKGGLIDIGETVAKGRGQPSAMVSLRHEAVLSVGLSIMTDVAEAVLTDFSGKVLAQRDLTPSGMGREAILYSLNSFIEDETAAIGATTRAVCGLGVSLTGFFTGPDTRVNTPLGLDDWALIDLRPLIETAIGLPTIIENSASAAAVGEYLFGCGRHIRSFAYFNMTAGLGAGIIIDGDLLRGTHGNAGEIGLPVTLGLPYAGLSSLMQALHDEGLEFEGFSDMISRYDDTWPGIDRWIEQRTPTFRLIANSFRYVLDIDTIVIGGRAPRALAERVARSIVWHEVEEPPRRDAGMPAPKIVVAELSGISAAIGAAALPLKQAYFA